MPEQTLTFDRTITVHYNIPTCDCCKKAAPAPTTEDLKRYFLGRTLIQEVETVCWTPYEWRGGPEEFPVLCPECYALGRASMLTTLRSVYTAGKMARQDADGC